MAVTLKIDVPPAALIYDKTKTRAILRAAGQEIAAVARSLIRAGKGVSSPGEAPNSKSGTLARSIRAKLLRRGDGVSVRAFASYALSLEVGAYGGGIAGSGIKRSHKKRTAEERQKAASGKRVLLPRPFLSTALESRASSIAERVKAAVQDGIKFQKQKP